MATVWTPDEFFFNLVRGYHGNMNSGTYKVALCLTAPTKAGTSVLADITQITTAGSYATGGNSVTMTWAETAGSSGIWQLGDSSSDVTFTPSGTYDDFRYAVLYQTNTTTITNGVVAVLDYGSTISGLTGPFEVNAGANGWARYTTPAWS
jgi:hypothetical protein